MDNDKVNLVFTGLRIKALEKMMLKSDNLKSEYIQSMVDNVNLLFSQEEQNHEVSELNSLKSHLLNLIDDYKNNL